MARFEIKSGPHKYYNFGGHIRRRNAFRAQSMSPEKPLNIQSSNLLTTELRPQSLIQDNM